MVIIEPPLDGEVESDDGNQKHENLNYQHNKVIQTYLHCIALLIMGGLHLVLHTIS